MYNYLNCGVYVNIQLHVSWTGTMFFLFNSFFLVNSLHFHLGILLSSILNIQCTGTSWCIIKMIKIVSQNLSLIKCFWLWTFPDCQSWSFNGFWRHIHKELQGKTKVKGKLWYWISTKLENITNFNYDMFQIQFSIRLHNFFFK